MFPIKMKHIGKIGAVGTVQAFVNSARQSGHGYIRSLMLKQVFQLFKIRVGTLLH
jgi:hypothetical protein